MNYLPKQIVWVALIASLLAGLAIGAAIRAVLHEKGSTEESERVDIRSRSEWGVQNQEQAIRQVVEVVGVPEDLLPGITAQLVTVAEDNTPFLSEQIAGRPLWQVVINKWRLHLRGFEDRYERTFDVLVDPVNGNILKVTSDWPEGIPGMAPEPAAWAAEEKMGRSGREKYHSFPDAKPSISFLEALNVLQREGIGSPLVAKQILGHYVVQSRMGREPKPVWAITLRGIDIPWPGGPRGAPETVMRRMRNIVHAETGEWLSASNQPALGSVHLESPPGTATFEPPPIPSPPPTVTLDLSSPSHEATVAPGELIDWTITATVSLGNNLGLALVAVDLVQDPGNLELFDIPPGSRPAGMVDFDRPLGISNPDPGGSAYGGTQIGTPGAMNLAQIGGAQNTFGVEGDGIGLDTDVDFGVGQGPGGQVIATGSFLAPCTAGAYLFSIGSGIANVLDGANPAPPSSSVRSATVESLANGTITFTVAGPAICPADTNGDNVVNVLDLIDVLLCFGYPAVPGCEAEDINGDGVVGVDDLEILIDVFGTLCCPGPPQQSLEEVLEDVGLSLADWEDFMEGLDDANKSEQDNWICWMYHYLINCPPNSRELCIGGLCPDEDPFDQHELGIGN